MAVQLSPAIHARARSPVYPGSDRGVIRQKVPDQMVPWTEAFADYRPPVYTHPTVAANPPWADDDEERRQGILKYNAVDGQINRQSFETIYTVTSAHLPLNPMGRTGLAGRGLLGKFGPNHAADPIVTRAVLEDKGTRKISFEVVLIKRNDNGQWALPGGMVEDGDTVGRTLGKEFCEEALDSKHGLNAEERELAQAIFLRDGGRNVYTGYMDDPRNTDNAWIETTAVHYHDAQGDVFSKVKLTAGDDAGDVAWVKLGPKMELYAAHGALLREVFDYLQQSVEPMF